MKLCLLAKRLGRDRKVYREETPYEGVYREHDQKSNGQTKKTPVWRVYPHQQRPLTFERLTDAVRFVEDPPFLIRED